MADNEKGLAPEGLRQLTISTDSETPVARSTSLFMRVQAM